MKTHAQGDRQRDWNWKANFNHAVTSYFVPLGWARYSYGGQEYNYWLDGIGGQVFLLVGLALGTLLHRWNQNRLDRRYERLLASS